MKPKPQDSRQKTAAALSPAEAARTMMVLGLLRSGAKHGYELHRIVVAHGSLYADFKKPTLYHLLHRLAEQGAVQVRSEGGARGPRGERLVFALADKGEALLLRLLRMALSSYDAGQVSFEVAAAYLPLLSSAEVRKLLGQRRAVVQERRDEVLEELERMADIPPGPYKAARELAADHSLAILDAEISWTDRSLRSLGKAAPARRPRPGRTDGARAQGR